MQADHFETVGDARGATAELRASLEARAQRRNVTRPLDPEAIQEGAGVTFVYRLDPEDLTSQSTLLEDEVIAVAEWARRESSRALSFSERKAVAEKAWTEYPHPEGQPMPVLFHAGFSMGVGGRRVPSR